MGVLVVVLLHGAASLCWWCWWCGVVVVLLVGKHTSSGDYYICESPLDVGKPSHLEESILTYLTFFFYFWFCFI